MTKRLFASLALFLVGCPETGASCAPGFERRPDGMCVMGIDGGRPIDGGHATDAGPCQGRCTTGQVCNPDTGDCVGCLLNGDCRAPTPYCLDSTHHCVECLMGVPGSPCTDATQARCTADGQCVPCVANDDCSPILGEGRTLCDTGRGGACVECMQSDQSACAGPAETCDLLEGRCVATGEGSVGACLPCTNDRQCVGGNRCVRLDYPVGTLHGYYCLPLFGACTSPYAPIMDRASLGNPAAGDYCGVNEALATCEAIAALEMNRACTGDGDCPNGGICRTVSGSPMHCTYACDDIAQCRATGRGSTCMAGADRYCGN